MLKVGLTGGIASGKSTVSQLFAQCGVPVIDADIIARELVRIGSPTLTEIIHLFGRDILTAQGALNRSQLRQHVFNDPQARKRLETILHPEIRQLIQRRSDALSAPYCLCVIPLLIEAKMTDLVDYILTIETPAEQQKHRLQQRDNIDSTLTESMIQSQSDTRHRLQIADNIIHNNHDIEQLKEHVTTLHQHYLTQAKLHNNAN